MDGSARVDEWRRLEDKLRAYVEGQGGPTITYNALLMLCGAAEADEGMSYSEGMLARFGQHRAAGLRQFYDSRYGAPAPDASGLRVYDTGNLIALAQELAVEAGRRAR